MGFLNRYQLDQIGFSDVGENVLISDKASIYNAENIKIGSHVRIDDFCILSAGESGIDIGNFVHISAFSSLMGAEKIILEDFVGISSKVSIFSSSDDYMGYGLTNPTVPDEFKKVKSFPVILKKHALVGAHSVLLPGTVLNQGTSVGALSVVSSILDEWYVYMGNPAKKRVRRSKKLLDKEIELKIDFPKVKFS
ncbi:acyltransferase [Vibrio cyclitrophicus]|uniref:acyltransferase n=1 Tax=Vibrio cyclitrophicus TaxID=47951 RepID=UPI000C82FED0|nr:galactoside O-acetyltransferase [Vibrio cyclitrophicus]PMF02078.1 galactoside O-acetyltransferase [Vibrio cyclitrophicus]PMO09164.1 galactoside O-acetyltransferase [Vibrio cyclitrophicus]